MQEASDAHSKTADSDTVSTYRFDRFDLFIVVRDVWQEEVFWLMLVGCADAVVLPRGGITHFLFLRKAFTKL